MPFIPWIYASPSSPPLVLTVAAEAPFFINAPGQSNELAGNIVILRAKAVGGPPPVYQWRKDGIDLPGETNMTLMLGAVAVGDSGDYEIVARNELGESSYAHRLQVSNPTGLDRWQWRLPRAQGSRLYKVAHAQGRYIATGKAGNLISSEDGTNWTSTTIEADIDLRAIGNGGVGHTPTLIAQEQLCKSSCRTRNRGRPTRPAERRGPPRHP